MCGKGQKCITIALLKAVKTERDLNLN